MAYQSDGKAAYLILHGANGAWLEEWVELEYDVERVIRELHESGLYEHAPYWTRNTERLLRGSSVFHGDILMRAMEICREKYGSCTWPGIPEECWAQAIEEYYGKA